MNKCIFFDLDGTLTDSGEGIINCAIFAMERLGIPLPEREEMRQFVGPPLRDTFVKFGVPADKAEEAITIFRSRYLPIGKFENFPYPGIQKLLDRLNTKGYRLFVATSKPEETAIEIMNKFDLARYFELICGATYDKSREDKSQVIAYLLNQIGQQTDAIMVGDTAFDVLGAAEHGIPTIGVAWGYGEVSDMEKAGAKNIAYSMDELYALLAQ